MKSYSGYFLILFALFLFSSSDLIASEWNIKGGADSEGPRCVIWRESISNREGLNYQNARIASFTLLSISPILTEFSYKFPNTPLAPRSVRVNTNIHGYPLVFENGFAWLQYSSDEQYF